MVEVQISSQSPMESTRSRSVGGDAERASSSVTMRFSRSESELEETRNTPVGESDAMD